MTITKAKSRDFTTGPLFRQMILFVLPVMLTGVLQVFYNMADSIVVGQFSGDPDALAAVGSTASVTAMIINVVIGAGSGVAMVISHTFGAKDNDSVSRAVHTSMLFALISGVFLLLVGVAFADPLLRMTGTKEEFFDKALVYMRIICIGFPATTLYNYSATILRSVGDSKTPLYVLSGSGLVNVGLNLVFVIIFKMSIAGVALATITSQYLSAALLIITLLRRKGECYALSFEKLRVDKGMLLRILRYGIPASLQSLVFSISNVIITAAINTFPVNTISAKTIAANIEGILYTALNSYSGAAITFVGQNYGAKKRKRINKSIYTAIIQVALFGAVITAITLLLGEPLALMYISEGDPNRNEVLAITLEILYMMTPAYIICGIMETLAGVNRGLGYSIAPMINNLIFTCGVRVLWIYVFFPMPVFASIRGLYLVYPISWILAILAHLVVIIIAQRKLKRMTRNDAVDVS